MFLERFDESPSFLNGPFSAESNRLNKLVQSQAAELDECKSV